MADQETALQKAQREYEQAVIHFAQLAAQPKVYRGGFGQPLFEGRSTEVSGQSTYRGTIEEMAKQEKMVDQLGLLKRRYKEGQKGTAKEAKIIERYGSQIRTGKWYRVSELKENGERVWTQQWRVGWCEGEVLNVYWHQDYFNIRVRVDLNMRKEAVLSLPQVIPVDCNPELLLSAATKKKLLLISAKYCQDAEGDRQFAWSLLGRDQLAIKSDSQEKKLGSLQLYYLESIMKGNGGRRVTLADRPGVTMIK